MISSNAALRQCARRRSNYMGDSWESVRPHEVPSCSEGKQEGKQEGFCLRAVPRSQPSTNLDVHYDAVGFRF